MIVEIGNGSFAEWRPCLAQLASFHKRVTYNLPSRTSAITQLKDAFDLLVLDV
jgi:hypothetical protein